MTNYSSGWKKKEEEEAAVILRTSAINIRITVYYFCSIAILKNDLFTLILSSLVSVLSVWMPNVRF